MTSPVKTAGWILLAGTLVAAAAGVVDRIVTAQQREVASAASKGFADADEMKKAETKGFSDAATWRAGLAEEAARKRLLDEQVAKKQADLQRQWEADAPKRAAQAEETRKRELAEWEDRQPPARRMSLANQSWSTGGFDTIGMMNFTVKNENPYDIKDFMVSYSFHGNSGTFLGERTHTVYETVKAKSNRAFVKINIGFIPSQSARGGCSLLSAVRK
jgi:hypothetical protein